MPALPISPEDRLPGREDEDRDRISHLCKLFVRCKYHYRFGTSNLPRPPTPCSFRYIHACTHPHPYTSPWIHTPTQAYIPIHTHTHGCIHTHTNVHSQAFTHPYTHAYASMLTFLHTCVCVHAHTQTSTLTSTYTRMHACTRTASRPLRCSYVSHPSPTLRSASSYLHLQPSSSASSSLPPLHSFSSRADLAGSVSLLLVMATVGEVGCADAGMYVLPSVDFNPFSVYVCNTMCIYQLCIN